MEPTFVEPENQPETLEPVADMTPTVHINENEITEIPKRTRRGKQPRSIEDLENVPAEEMSSTEVVKYIQHMREELNLLKNQLQTMRDSFNGTQQQRNKVDQELQKFKLAAKTQIQFCKDTIAQAYKTLHYMQPLED